MKTQNSTWFTIAVFGLLSLALAIMVTGCGKKGGGGDDTRYRGSRHYDPNCPSCSGSTDHLASGHGLYMNGQIKMGMDIFAAAQGGGVYGGSSYAGPVFVEGYMYVNNPDSFYGCPIRHGLYHLKTLQPNGDFNRQNTFDLRNFFFEAIHTDGTVVEMWANKIEFYDRQSVIGDDGYQYEGGLWGDFVIERVRVHGGSHINCPFASMHFARQ